MKVTFRADFLYSATDRVLRDRVPRALDLMGRAMFEGSGVLLLEVLQEFCERARREGVPQGQVRSLIAAWRAVLPVYSPGEEDFCAALEAWEGRWSFADATLWSSARRAGVTHVLTGAGPRGFDKWGLAFIDPFLPENDQLIDRILPPL